MKDLIITHVSGYKSHTMKQIVSPEATLVSAKIFLDNALTVGDWWISAGTAIGLYRDGDFIPSDTDIDIGVRASNGQKHIEIPEFRLIRKMDWKGLPIQTAYVDNSNGCIFDIYYYYDDLIPNHLVTVSEYGWVYHKKLFIKKPLFGIKRLKTKYGFFPFLDPIEDYLKDRFGKNWRVPSDTKGKYVHIPELF